MATSVEQVVNQALEVIAYPRRIGWIFEGTEAAIAALEFFGQTRDEVLRAQDWPFARGAGVPLALLKGPPPPGGYNAFNQVWSPAYPPSPWLFEYAYPADCLDILALQGQPAMLPELNPLPVEWRIDNDLTPVVTTVTPPVVAGPPQKVILANVPNALAVYRRRVTNPALWEPLFVTTLVPALAAKLSLRLIGSGQEQQAKGREEVGAAAIADRHKG